MNVIGAEPDVTEGKPAAIGTRLSCDYPITSALLGKWICLFVLVASGSAFAEVKSPLVEGLPSGKFGFYLDGIEVPVIAYKDIHYARFALAGTAQVRVVTKDGPVTTARIQPTAYGISHLIEGNAVNFTIARPMALVVQLDFREKLFLFADPPAESAPEDAVDATTLGAIGDGKTDNTAILQAAIDTLPMGGTLVLPAGHFRSGSLRLRSAMRLHLSSGAFLHALDDHTRITPIPGSTAFIGFLSGSDLHDVAITGAGTIDANGYVVRKAYEAALGIKKQAGRLLYLRDSKNISIRGVTLRDSYSWNVQFLRCDEVSVSWIKILSDVRLSNHDGIDVVGCSNVEVADSFLFCEDDGITPKAAEDREVAENQVYRNLVIWAHKANGIRIGSESACRVMRHFRFEDIHILNGSNGIRLDTTEGAIYEDFTFRNVRIEDLLQHYDERYERNRERRMIEENSHALVLFVTRESTKAPLGAIRRITFDGLHWNDARYRARIDMPDAIIRALSEEKIAPPVTDILFRSCTVAGKPVRTAADFGMKANDGILSERVRFEP